MLLHTEGLKLEKMKKACGQDEGRFQWDLVRIEGAGEGRARITATDGRMMVERIVPAEGEPREALVAPGVFKGALSVALPNELGENVITTTTKKEVLHTPAPDGRHARGRDLEQMRKKILGKSYRICVRLNPALVIDLLTALSTPKGQFVRLFASDDGKALLVQSDDGHAFLMPVMSDDGEKNPTTPTLA